LGRRSVFRLKKRRPLLPKTCFFAVFARKHTGEKKTRRRSKKITEKMKKTKQEKKPDAQAMKTNIREKQPAKLGKKKNAQAMENTKPEEKKNAQAMGEKKREEKKNARAMENTKPEEKKNAQAMETDIREIFFISCLVFGKFYMKKPAALCFLPCRRLFYVPACHPANSRDMYARYKRAAAYFTSLHAIHPGDIRKRMKINRINPFSFPGAAGVPWRIRRLPYRHGYTGGLRFQSFRPTQRRLI
jgi:flagellar biosynthesis GTPase FlhF